MNDSIGIICPLYNAENYIGKLHNDILKQKYVNLKEIQYILTRSSDETEKCLKDLNVNYEIIEPCDFSHSLVREKAAFQMNTDIIVFITQDIDIGSDTWLYYLTESIIENRCVAAYSRQVAKSEDIEKYIRNFNYPEASFYVSSKDINNLGLKTFFFSDVSSAIRKSIFVNINGYDNKNLPISEDMYLAYKVIMNGYTIKYCADSVVIHSHNYSFKELYKRYKETGKFFKDNKYLDRYSINGSGFDLALYVFKNACKDFNLKVLVQFFPNMFGRFIGMKIGKHYG